MFLKKKYPNIIKEVRGVGSHNGIVLNTSSNKLLKHLLSSFPSDLISDPRFLSKLYTSAVMSELFSKHNILTYLGQNKEIVLMISPSLIVTDTEIDIFIKSLDATLGIGKYQLISNFVKQKLFS